MSAMKVDGESIDGGSNGSVEENSMADWDGSCLAPKDYISSTARNIFKSKLRGGRGRGRRRRNRVIDDHLNNHVYSNDDNIDEWEGDVEDEEEWEVDDEDEDEWEGDDEGEENDGEEYDEEEESENSEIKNNEKEDIKQNGTEEVKMATTNTNGFETCSMKEDAKTFENNKSSDSSNSNEFMNNGEISIPIERDNKQDEKKEKDREENKLAIVQNIFECVHSAVKRYGEGDLALACLSNIVATDLQVNHTYCIYHYFSPSACLPASLSASLPACLPLCLPVCMCVCRSACFVVCLSVCMSVCMHVCLSVHLYFNTISYSSSSCSLISFSFFPLFLINVCIFSSSNLYRHKIMGERGKRLNVLYCTLKRYSSTSKLLCNSAILYSIFIDSTPFSSFGSP